MGKYSFSNGQFKSEAADRILAHFSKNPFRLHFAAWLIAAVPFALFLLPEFSVGSVVGFGISAIIFCTFLCVVTYPFSGHFSFTIVGALFGASIIPLCELLGVFAPIDIVNAQVGLVVGGVMGSSSVVWRVPLQLLDGFRTTGGQA